MTVKALIKQLRMLPEDFTVYVSIDGQTAFEVTHTRMNLVHSSSNQVIPPDEMDATGYHDSIVIETADASNLLDRRDR